LEEISNKVDTLNAHRYVSALTTLEEFRTESMQDSMLMSDLMKIQVLLTSPADQNDVFAYLDTFAQEIVDRCAKLNARNILETV
jgi:hypothetical protein